MHTGYIFAIYDIQDARWIMHKKKQGETEKHQNLAGQSLFALKSKINIFEIGKSLLKKISRTIDLSL